MGAMPALAVFRLPAADVAATAARRAVAPVGRPGVALTLLAQLLWSSCNYSIYHYSAVLLGARVGLDAMPQLLLFSGLGSWVGAFAGGRLADRFGVTPPVLAIAGGNALNLALLPMTGGTLIGADLALFFSASPAWSVVPAQQSRLLAHTPSPWRNTERKRRFGDEDIARHQFEGRAGRIGNVFVIAGSDDAQPVRLDRDLRRAEHMTDGMEGDFRAAEADAFSVARRLDRAGKILAIAQPHEIERLLCGQHRAMPGARMIGMGMRDQRALDRTGGVDMEAAELAAHTGRRQHQDVFRTHCE